MKKFLVGFALPAAAAIAVVGSGFSVWYFGDKEQSENEASINVTQLVKVGSFQQDAKSVLVLDQTAAGREQFGKDSGIEAHGIYMTAPDQVEGWTGKITYTPIGGVENAGSKVKASIKTYIFVPTIVNGVLKMNGATKVADFAKYDYKPGDASTKSFTPANYVAYSYSWTDDDIANGVTLPKLNEEKPFFYFSYVKEATNDGDYQALVTATKDKTISIVSEAVLVSA